jgi:TRAP-type C4-dicarboxylate transport system substrate-binding protein
MTRNTGETRRRLLTFLSALPVSLCSAFGKAQSSQLELASYFLGETPSAEAAQLFAEEVTEDSAGTVRISVEMVPPWVPFAVMSKASALAHYCAPEFANVEPILGLSALPMLTATFDEAEILLRIARPYYCSALARHDQVLLATQPWRPVALWSTFRIRSAADLRGSLFPISSYVGEQAGWGRTLIRLNARRASFSDAEFTFSSGYTTDMKFTQEFAFFTEIFLAAQLNFLTVSRTVFELLSKAEQRLLIATGQPVDHLAVQRFLNGDVGE